MTATASIPTISVATGVPVLAGAIESLRAARAARRARIQLENDLRLYTRTTSDRAEIDAILARYPETDAHAAWATVTTASIA